MAWQIWRKGGAAGRSRRATSVRQSADERLPLRGNSSLHTPCKVCHLTSDRKIGPGETPVALVAPREIFAEYETDAPPKFPLMITVSYPGMKQWISWAPPYLPLSREGAICYLIGQMSQGHVSVSSLGGNSRQFYMIRKAIKESIARNFFCIGKMGHVYALSYGVSMGFPSGRVFCIDGERSFLMHAGNNALLAGISPPNIIHVVIYNGVYGSTGNHPVTIRRENLVSLARGLPYEQKFFVDDVEGLEKACKASHKSTLIIVAVNESPKATFRHHLRLLKN